MSRVTGKAFLGRIVLPMAAAFVLGMDLAGGVHAGATRNVSKLPTQQLGVGSAYHPHHDEAGSDEQESDEAGCDEQGSDEKESDEAGPDKQESDEAGCDEQGSDEKESDEAEADDAPRHAGDRAKASDPTADGSTPSPNRSTPSPNGNTASPGVGSVPASCNGYTGNRQMGCALLLKVGYNIDQMSCLDRLWTKESGWNPSARNPSSGAYGIPQSLPANKMATSGSDWRTNPATQIKWGLDYIKDRYGTPCAAWNHSQRTNWY